MRVSPDANEPSGAPASVTDRRPCSCCAFGSLHGRSGGVRTELKKGAAPGGCESGWGAAQGFVGRALGDPGLKPTVRVGEAAMREVAAYLLDHERFARVPTTALVKARAAAKQAAA